MSTATRDKEPTMPRLALIALVVGLAAALAACGEDETAAPQPTAPATPTPSPTETEPGDGEPTEPAPTPTPTEREPDGNGADEVTVFFVRDHDSGVWVEPEVVALDEPTVALARAAMEVLVAGGAREPGRMTLAGDDAEVLDVNRDGDLLIVDFSEGLVPGSGLGSAYEAALVQQIAHTGAQFDGVDAVRILVEGAEIESLAGHVDTSEPVVPDPLDISPVVITSHTSGDEVGVGEVTVGGTACTFEATVELELIAPDGSVAEETFTTATIACPERGDWSHSFDLSGPGAWTVLAVEPDPSGGEGRPPFDVSVELEATGG